ncbi:MAG: hypothetical protein IPJ41_17335 [Phycisphaerales bacterium]|nr:hypothetical protein [Phycisphaerales bacterium]
MTLGELTINDLSIYAEVAMVIFLVIFLAVAAWAVRKPKNQLNTWARLPLDETAPARPDTKN